MLAYVGLQVKLCDTILRWRGFGEMACPWRTYLSFYLALYDTPRGLVRRRLCWYFFDSQYSWRCIRHRETFRLSDTAVVELMFAVYAQRRRRSRHTTLQLLRRSRLPSSHGFPATTEVTLYTTFCGQYTQTCVDPRFCQKCSLSLTICFNCCEWTHRYHYHFCLFQSSLMLFVLSLTRIMTRDDHGNSH